MKRAISTGIVATLAVLALAGPAGAAKADYTAKSGKLKGKNTGVSVKMTQEADGEFKFVFRGHFLPNNVTRVTVTSVTPAGNPFTHTLCLLDVQGAKDVTCRVKNFDVNEFNAGGVPTWVTLWMPGSGSLGGSQPFVTLPLAAR